MIDYEVKIYKGFLGNDKAGGWCNTHEFRSDAVIDSPAMLQIVTEIANFEKEFHTPAVNFLRGVVSVWNVENTGYNPLEMRTCPIGGLGTLPVDEGYELYDLNFALDVKRNLSTGRAGHSYFRGCVTEPMAMITSSGHVTLTPDGATLIEAQVTQGQTSYFAPGKTMGVRSFVKATNQTIFRPILSFNFGRMILMPRDHKFFHKGWRRGEAPGLTPPDAP
jgi:hypothetical protein